MSADGEQAGVKVTVAPHPLLDLGGFTSSLPAELAALETPAWLRSLLAIDAPAPFARDELTRGRIRDLLRHGGYRPTGRGKPASEYLVKAATEGALDSINVAVDVCNAVSLHSGLPISVVDLDCVNGPLQVDLGRPAENYVFNLAGHAIELEGLVVLRDADGPCANPVKDSQRTKTHAHTRRTLSLVWGSRELGDRTEQVVSWYRRLLTDLGAATVGTVTVMA
ncbi:MAG: phenylalanine--tRNA ligase beta subunit-related protein [Planctomycetota bacterium]